MLARIISCEFHGRANRGIQCQRNPSGMEPTAGFEGLARNLLVGEFRKCRILAIVDDLPRSWKARRLVVVNTQPVLGSPNHMRCIDPMHRDEPGHLLPQAVVGQARDPAGPST